MIVFDSPSETLVSVIFRVLATGAVAPDGMMNH
jgi:hypothetical protein